MKISRRPKLVTDSMLHALLQEFEAGTKPVEGGLSYKRWDFRDLFEILPDAFTVTPTISRSEAINLFSQALRECRRDCKMNADAIINSATVIQKNALAVPNTAYSLWTKFRATNMVRHKGFKLKWRGVSLRTAAYLPAWLQRDEYFLNGFGRIYPSKPYGYGHVIITCSDRTEDRAVDRMTDALQLILGLLNLYETWGNRNIIAGRIWSEGKLWSGPNHFVFREKDFRGEDRIWYDPNYDEEAWNIHPLSMDRVLGVVPWTRKALAALENHPLSDVLVRSILLLQDGFVTRESSHRLLRFWSALEQIYVEPEDKTRSNEKLIERAIFAESNPELSKWKLEHIARLRNDYVHAGGSNDDLHHMCQFLRELLSRHINHWIHRGHIFRNHNALLQLVRLPSDRAALIEMQEMISRRITYLDGAPSKSEEG